jgi:DNA-binding CsgD family transcriptional regulator
MSKAASAARAVARIKQLCCLGLSSQAIMPSLLKELHELVASHANAFLWGDPRHQIENYLSEELDEAAPWPLVQRSKSRKRRKRTIASPAAGLQQEALAGQEMFKLDRRAHCCHDYQRLPRTASRRGHTLRAIVAINGRVLGAILLHRAVDDPCFTAQDAIRLAAIIPWLAQALITPSPELETPLVHSGDNGLLIVNGSGQIQHVSARARQLLYLATHPVNSCEANTYGELPQSVSLLCCQLVNALASQMDGSNPPVWRCCNRWGGFLCRAEWLDYLAPATEPLIGIIIERQEPLPLKLMRHMAQLPLSNRQAEVCLSLAAGYSRPAIARRLNVSEHTAVTYTRQVYERLHVHNRSELMSRLLLLE